MFEFDQVLLDACRERAARYDRENTFFREDFEALRDAGYLTIAIPEELGGRGMRLHDVAASARRLASYAPATALGLNMHQYWVGIAADLFRAGDTSLEWVLREAAAGKVFASGHAESGNDLPVLLSTTRAERVEGGYRLDGRKGFSSLTPVWDWIGVHAMDTSDPAAPKIVHAFVGRDCEGVQIRETWDVLGMRATRSDDTILEGVFVPEHRLARVVPAGAKGIDAFVLNVFAWALLNFGNIYLGIAQRAFDLTVQRLKSRKSIALTRTMAYHPAAQTGVAQMVLALESVGAQLDAVTRDWSAVDGHGPEFLPRVVAAKFTAVEQAFAVVDTSLDLSGGGGMFKSNELERLFRDCRAGRFHPTNRALTHEILGKVALGIDLDEGPRWG